MTKRDMMNRYYDERALHSAELALKHGIEDGSIHLNGDEISGNTFDARLAIKEYFGARWDGVKKCWRIMKEQQFAELIFEKGLIV